MNAVDWDMLFSEDQLSAARRIVEQDPDDPRLRDRLIQEILVDMEHPVAVTTSTVDGFVQEYGGYLLPILGRLLLEHLTLT